MTLPDQWTVVEHLKVRDKNDGTWWDVFVEKYGTQRKGETRVRVRNEAHAQGWVSEDRLGEHPPNARKHARNLLALFGGRHYNGENIIYEPSVDIPRWKSALWPGR